MTEKSPCCILAHGKKTPKIIKRERRTTRVAGPNVEKGFLGFDEGGDSGYGSASGLWSGRWCKNADIVLGIKGTKLKHRRGSGAQIELN